MGIRNVRWERTCDLAVESLGGYEAIDEALFIYLDALERDPTKFPRVNTDWGSVRYIRTKPYGDTPELVWYFVIESNGDVAIAHVERYEPD
jgi:hypothetical protein